MDWPTFIGFGLIIAVSCLIVYVMIRISDRQKKKSKAKKEKDIIDTAISLAERLPQSIPSNPFVDFLKFLGNTILNNLYPLSVVVVCIGAGILLALAFITSLRNGEFSFAFSSLLGMVIMWMPLILILKKGVHQVKALPPQRGIPRILGQLGKRVLSPGYYLEIPRIFTIKDVDVSPQHLNIPIERILCTTKDQPDLEHKASEILAKLPLEEGGGSVSGSAELTIVPDTQNPERLIQYVTNGGKHPGGSLEYARVQFQTTLWQTLDEIGKIYTWSTLASSGSRVSLLAVYRLTGMTPENLRRLMPELMNNNHPSFKALKVEGIDLTLYDDPNDGKNKKVKDNKTPVSFEWFWKIMGIIGFPDNMGLGTRIYKLTIDVEEEEHLKKRASGVAAERLERQQEVLDMQTELQMIEEVMASAKAHEHPLTWDQAKEQVQLARKEIRKISVDSKGGPVIVDAGKTGGNKHKGKGSGN